MEEKRKIWITFLLVLTVPVLAYGIMELVSNRLMELPVIGPVTQQDGSKVYHTVPEYTLTSHKGEDFTYSPEMGKITVVDFFFSTCPTICPAMTTNLTTVSEHYAADTNVVLISITVDPSTDTPEQLASYREDYGITDPNWYFLTGEKRELYRLARNAYFITAAEGDGGPHDFIHSENLVLVDHKGRIRGFYKGTEAGEATRLIKDIDRVKQTKK